MDLSRLGRLFLASLVATNGVPGLLASTSMPTPAGRNAVVTKWANALGLSADLAETEISTIDYWGTGTVTLNGAPCALTSYRASVNYQIPSMRLDFRCIDASGRSHHEIQVVADRFAWDEAEAGDATTAVMSAVNDRLVHLWSDPLGLVKAAVAAGAEAEITADGGETMVAFPVPGVAGATVKATLGASNRAEHVETRLGQTLIETTYSDYVELNGADLRFDTYFPRHIVQKQNGLTLADLTVTRTSTANHDIVMTVPGPVMQMAPAAAKAAGQPGVGRNTAPSIWKDKKTFAKLDGSLRRTVERGCAGPQSVIVRTQPGYRSGLRDSLNAHGSEVSGEYASINAVGASVSCNDLQTLAGFKSTLSVSSNARVLSDQAADDTPVPAADAPPAPQPDAVDARDAEGEAAAVLQAPMLQTLLGDNYQQLRSAQPTKSMGIAVIDSGIASGPDFGDRITAFYDFTHGDIRAAAPSDEYGHGTHVAGLAASKYVGVDPSARLIGLKVLDANGQGSSDAVLRAIEFAIVNKDLLNIQVLNLSLGHPIYESAATDPMVQAVESAVRAGLVVVVAAGNLGLKPHTLEPGYSGIVSPANAPSAFSIGAVRTHDTATRDDDQIALFSSRGPTRYDGFAKPDFSAPGQNLLSVATPGSTLRIKEEAKGNPAGNYMRLNGTSMAAGVVSGFAALVLQTNPTLTPNTLKALFEYSAIDVKNLTYTGSADFLTQGAGEIGGGALTLAANIDTTVPVGTRWLAAGIAPSTMIDGEAKAWVQRLLWGNYPVSGADLLDDQRLAWAGDMVWGNSLVDEDDNIVWGNSLADDNIVWGNSLDDDLDNIVWGNSLAEDLDNIVWGNSLDDDDNIVWGNSLDDDDNIVWGNSLDDDDNIVWGNSLDDDNIVWGNSLDDDDNIVWGNSTTDDVDNLVVSEPSTGRGSGRWLWSPGTRIVIRSTAVQTLVKRHHKGGTN